MLRKQQILVYLLVASLNLVPIGVTGRHVGSNQAAAQDLTRAAPVSTAEDSIVYSNPQILGIPDDSYTGGFGAGMACSNITTTSVVPAGSVVLSAFVNVQVDHTWIGDLTIKLRSPSGSILTILNRPGSTAPDDGSDTPVGDNSNWANGTAIDFGDGLGPEAETMGGTITDAQNICVNDGICSHDPSPDTAPTPPTSFSALRNTPAGGVWTLCVGDSALLDTGSLRSWSLNLVHANVYAANPNLTVPDDGYLGGFGGPGQACSTIAVPSSFVVQSAFVSVDMQHTWVGDLTMKLRSPSGTTFTLLNRPGSNAADDGGGAVGANANWNGFLLFGDGFGPEAETMGSGLTTDQIVCTTNGVCSHDPSPDTAASPASFAAAFNGQTSSTSWTLCVGDSALGDIGLFRSWRLNLVSPLAPSAASVSIGGRVVSALGSSIPLARVTLTNAAGETRSALTNAFGHYSFDGVTIGETYSIGVEAKGYSFEPRTISVVDEVVDLDFVGQPALVFK